MTIAISLASFVAWIVLAVTAGMMAEGRGQPPTFWFLVALVAPLLSIAVLVVFFDRDGFADDGPDGIGSTAESESARRAYILRALAARPRLSIHALASEAQGSEPDELLGHLGVLQGHGLVDRDPSGSWSVTPEGERAVEHATSSLPSER
jgi:DNA-binding transcriptional ArsR family regulator